MHHGMNEPTPRPYPTGTPVTWTSNGSTYLGVVMSAPLQAGPEEDHARLVRVDWKDGQRTDQAEAHVRVGDLSEVPRQASTPRARPSQVNADLAVSQALVALHAAQALLESQESLLALARVRDVVARCEDAEEAILHGEEEAGHYQNGYRKGKADAKAGRKRAFYESTQDGVPCVMRVREPGSVTMVPPHELTHARGYLDGYARAQDQAFMD